MTTANQFAPVWNSSGVNYTAIRADITDIASSGGSTLLDLRVNNNSRFSINKTGSVAQGPAQISTLTSTNKGLIVQGAAAQSANLQEWQNSAGGVLASVDRDGDITASTGTFTFVQLTSSIPRQSGLLFLDTGGLLNTSPNLVYDRSNLASPKLVFKASGTVTPDISLNILTTASGSTSGVQTLSFEGSAGQLFSISDVLNSGTIFSVNDISGLPLLEIDATGLVSLARFGTGIVAHTPISLGGTTASFPSIRRSGITTQFRLADNSADSAISAGSGVFSANLISNPSISGVLSVNGQLMLERSSDTQLNFVYRGNDSTTRRVAVPLTNGALLNKAGDTLTGTINVTEIINTPTGVSQTISLGSGNHQTLSLGSAAGTVAVTLTVPSASAVGSLIVTQGATIRNVTWSTSSGSIIWMGGEPVWITDNSNSSRIMAWRWDGSNMRLAVSEMSA